MSLVARVEAVLLPGGLLASRWPGYEDRRAQLDMARDVARTIERGGVLLAEAPTGVGKSLAYLLPAVLHASETDERVIVATCTRSLQDQLFERDLPALLDALGLALPVARLKGKSNYLCPRALDLIDGQGAEETLVIEWLKSWAASDDSGDLDRFECDDPEAFRRVRPKVAADPSACRGAICRRGRECFWARARRRASEARLTIVNHALLARAADAEGLLPDAEVLIVDEAHRLEGVLTSQLERGVSRNRLEELLKLTGSGKGGRRAGGILARVRSMVLPMLHSEDRRARLDADLDRLGQRVEEVRADGEAFFGALAPGAVPATLRPAARALYSARNRYRSAGELMGRELQPLEVLLEHCTMFATTLRRASSAVASAEAGEPGEALMSELELVSSRWEHLGGDLSEISQATDPDWVYWQSRSPGSKTAELRGAPVWVGDHARRMVLSRARASILTSATLSSAGDFDWAAERLGLGEQWGLPYETASYPSPFPLHQQMRAFVYETGADEAAGIGELIVELMHASERNLLVLFTAHQRLKRVREHIAGRLPVGRKLLAQEWDGPAGLLAERFRNERGAVLLGVQSLWEGVDFPGETLELLVVAKLPFSVPDDPLVEARGERLRERGLDPFRDDAVPEAVVRFRQGVGRLIRRSDDRGVLVVCDPRLATASYRGPFRAALPVEPQWCRDPRELAVEAARFLSGDGVAVGEDG